VQRNNGILSTNSQNNNIIFFDNKLTIAEAIVFVLEAVIY